MFSAHGYDALRHGLAVVRRSDRGVLRLTGTDRATWLQGLVTNDVATLLPGEGCYAAYLTAQGRMIADMRVFELGDALLVDLDGTLAESVANRWSQFIFSEDAQVQTISSSTAEIGVYGPHAAEALAAALAGGAISTDVPDGKVLRSLPLYSNARASFRAVPIVVVASDEIGVRGFDVVLPVEHKEDLATLLRASGAVDTGGAAVEVCRIEGGRPLFLTDMHEDTIPLEAGIEDRAISLTKGCYVGQEIIIRVLHRGHGRVARKLVGLTLDPGAAVPARGDVIASGNRDMGAITSAVDSPTLARPVALGYVQRDFVQPGTVVEIAGTPASVAALPFVPVTPLI
jgi:folate-binding protein YgfZ